MARDPLSSAAFRDAALYHLARYACSRVGLKRVLQRRLQRLRRQGIEGGDEGASAAIEAVIEAVLDALTAQGLLNDATFAESRARSLSERGLSVRAIEGKLRLLGVDTATIAHGLARVAREQGREDSGGPSDHGADHQAATRYARRRRLGPWRSTALPSDPKERAKVLQRELRSLASRGFSLTVAHAVLAGRPVLAGGAEDEGENADNDEFYP